MMWDEGTTEGLRLLIMMVGCHGLTFRDSTDMKTPYMYGHMCGYVCMYI